MLRKDRLHPLLEDVLLLHGLGVHVVLVCGAREMIDAHLCAAGEEPLWVGAYRVTDKNALTGAIQAAGAISTEVSAFLSRAPSIPMVRRHARGEGSFHFAPAVQVVSGNYVTAKRRGIVNGVDFGERWARAPVWHVWEGGDLDCLWYTHVCEADGKEQQVLV